MFLCAVLVTGQRIVPGTKWNAGLPLSVWCREGPRRCRSNLAIGHRAPSKGLGLVWFRLRSVWLRGSDSDRCGSKAQYPLLASVGELEQEGFLAPSGNKPFKEFFVSFAVPWI